MKRFILLLIVALFVVLGAAGKRYYAWATNAANAADPFDEVGIGLHSYMPGFVQDWGCAHLKQAFGTRTLPPHGCGNPVDPTQWK